VHVVQHVLVHFADRAQFTSERESRAKQHGERQTATVIHRRKPDRYQRNLWQQRGDLTWFAVAGYPDADILSLTE